jgi:hypothetical protein
MVKIFTSGSFFDGAEVPPPARDGVARHFRGSLLVVESRPEHISTEVLEEFLAVADTRRWDPSLYVAIVWRRRMTVSGSDRYARVSWGVRYSLPGQKGQSSL